MSAQPKARIHEKIDRLQPDRLAEVEDFIDFIASRESERSLVRAAQAISEKSLHAVWDNAEDAAYDQL